jgi:glycosyltransferase involved in cell wall biosynthesis
MTLAPAHAPRRPDVAIVLDRLDRSHFLGEGLRRRGLRVTLYHHAPTSSRHVAIPGGFVGGLAHLTRRTDHDLYLTSASFAPALQLYCNRRLTGRPYVFILNGAIWQFFKDRRAALPLRRFLDGQFYPSLLRRILAGAQRIICNSHYLRAALAEAFPGVRDKSLTIHNGIDFEKFSGPPRGTLARLVSVTTLNNENKSRGVLLLLDAVDRILSARPDASFTLAVKTSNRIHEERLQRHLAAKQTRDRITVLSNHPDVAALLRASGLFLFSAAPDSEHSLPRALLEAQAVGLPAVTTATAGCGEVVQDAETGFTVPYDADALARAALSLMSDPSLAASFGRQARRSIPRTFSWETMADRYRDTVIEILDPRSPAAPDRRTEHADDLVTRWPS